MLYFSNLIRSPLTRSLQSNIHSNTKFIISVVPTKIYKWTFNKALNEYDNELLLNYKETNLNLLFNGLFENLDKKYLKFLFDIRVTFSNGTDFSLSTCTFITTDIHNIIDKRLNLNSHVKEFTFQPYKDTIYVNMKVINNQDKTDSSKINLQFKTFGFDLLKL